MSLVPGSLNNKTTKSLINLTRIIGENNAYFFQFEHIKIQQILNTTQYTNTKFQSHQITD